MKLEKLALLSLGLVPLTAVLCLISLSLVTIQASVEKQTEEQLKFVAWNIESGGSDPKVIAEQLQDFREHEIIALNEVAVAGIEIYKEALGSDFESFVSKTGRNDRLAILWNRNRFELLSKEEMSQYQDNRLNDGNHRSPIFVRLRDKVTDQRFIVMTNHLARRNKKLRREQAAGLREWARDLSEPIIAMGDFNFDYSFIRSAGNESFSEFMRDGVWQWVKPNPLIDSNFSDTDGDGKDNYPDSMLDFVFLANGAKRFQCQCSILKREGDFPDDKTTSDHRATELRLKLN